MAGKSDIMAALSSSPRMMRLSCQAQLTIPSTCFSKSLYLVAFFNCSKASLECALKRLRSISLTKWSYCFIKSYSITLLSTSLETGLQKLGRTVFASTILPSVLSYSIRCCRKSRVINCYFFNILLEISRLNLRLGMAKVCSSMWPLKR